MAFCAGHVSGYLPSAMTVFTTLDPISQRARIPVAIILVERWHGFEVGQLSKLLTAGNDGHYLIRRSTMRRSRSINSSSVRRTR